MGFCFLSHTSKQNSFPPRRLITGCDNCSREEISKHYKQSRMNFMLLLTLFFVALAAVAAADTMFDDYVNNAPTAESAQKEARCGKKGGKKGGKKFG
ncbi:Hypothetical protein NTJ_16114 [Nesidiocoris tenuis]|uniref:Uncharacterized protein n=1 Tax=Nesidiocoris tenuis TaxID=355587 RepID=A0ABN7BG24_9HEMI|nr:Hypothetical protein NTJ_16114 [Nesidiocoris tenuis]